MPSSVAWYQKVNMQSSLKFIFTLLFSLFLTSFAFAQSAPLYIDQYPKQLKAEEDVFFTLKSTEDFNLEETNIIWKIDGTTYDQGIGRTTFKTKTPKQNTSRTVTAYIEVPGQSPIYVSLPLRASPFILLYEGKDSVAPTFYKGRKLPSREGSVRIGILTAGKGYTTDFVVNGAQALNSPNSLITSTSRITETALDVQATVKQNSDIVAYINKEINLVKPEVYLFREDKTSSLQQQISGSEKGGDIYVSVEPYFFTGKNKYDEAVRYVWRLNEEIKNVTEPWFIKLISTKPETLQAKIEVRQAEKITQRAEKVFTAIFN